MKTFEIGFYSIIITYIFVAAVRNYHLKIRIILMSSLEI